MKRQRGYIGIDFGVLFAILIGIGVAAGLVLAWLVPIVWSWVRPLIHGWTA